MGLNCKLYPYFKNSKENGGKGSYSRHFLVPAAGKGFLHQLLIWKPTVEKDFKPYSWIATVGSTPKPCPLESGLCFIRLLIVK